MRLTFLLLLISSIAAFGQQASIPTKDYVPSELQASDPDVKALLDSADTLSRQGNYTGSLQQLIKAHDLCTARSFKGDAALVEDEIAVSFFVQGKLDDAKHWWLNALSDSAETANLVLQADTLVALSSLTQAAGDLNEALKLANKALEISRKSKNLFIQARALGELGRLQVVMGKREDARASVEEALRIDRVNQYKWEALHLLYLAYVTSPDNSGLDQAIPLVRQARELAIKNENYLVFMSASTSLGQALVQKGQLKEGIALLENSRNGIGEDGKPLFSHSGSYQAAMAQAFPRFAFLEAIATAYESSQRLDDALKTWQDLYDKAKTAGFSLAAAEAAFRAAGILATRKRTTDAIAYYSLSADSWAAVGNTSRRILAMMTEASLLLQQGEIDKAVHRYQEVLSLQQTSSDTRGQFITDLVIAEIVQPRGDIERTTQVLRDAESLLAPDLTIPGIKPNLILEMYLRSADLDNKKGDPLSEIIALEKAMTPAEAVDVNAMALVDARVQKSLVAMHVRESADEAYSSGDLATALRDYELIQHFEQTDARWNGKLADYNKQSPSQTASRVLAIPFAMISQPEGAVILESNLRQLGPIAALARIPILIALSNYYIVHERPDMVVKFTTAALPFLRLGETDQPNTWDVELICELSDAQMLQKDLVSAVQNLEPCLRSAKRLGDLEHLTLAHQTNVWVLQAAGKPEQAQESVRFLVEHAPDDPLHYVQLAQLRTSEGNVPEAIEAWRHALQLFETKKDSDHIAAVHLALASALGSVSTRENQEQLSHLNAALDLYKKLGNVEGHAQAALYLGQYFQKTTNWPKARKALETALDLSRQANKPNVEATVLSSIGDCYRSAGDPLKALDAYQKAERIFKGIDDPAQEAFQIRSEAWALYDLHRSEDAFQAALRAKNVADSSASWLARYWTRRLLAQGYQNRGEYEHALDALREALSISDSANQPLNSAWTEVELGVDLMTIGDWEEARNLIDSALPIFRQFKDADSEFSADSELISIYGARESQLKDLDKALEYYESANGIVRHKDPEKASWLSLDVVEIYWQQKRFRDAIAKASEALEYFQRSKNDWGTASALISLAEVERSDGDVHAAEISLERATPLVKHLQNFYMTGRLYYGQANLQKQERNYSLAIEQYERVIDLLEEVKSSSDLNNRRKASENYDFIYEDLIDSYYLLSTKGKENEQVAADKALWYSELNKSRVFTTSWGRTFIDVLRHQLPAELQERERTLSVRHNALQNELEQSMSGQSHQAASGIREQLQKVAKEQSTLEQEVRQANPAYGQAAYPQHFAIQDLPLHPGEIFVEFKMLEESLLVWMVQGSPSGSQLIGFYKVDRSRKWFEERILQIRDAFNRGQLNLFDPRVCEELFNNLFPEPFVQHVIAAKSMIFVPDDVLFLLPFEMLSPRASQTQFILLRTPTTYFPSAAALRLSRTMVRGKREWPVQFLGIADPVTSADDERYIATSVLSGPELARPESPAERASLPLRGQLSIESLKTRGYIFDRLPNTAIEVSNIASLFPGAAQIRTGADAKKQQLLQTDLERFRFIHFATHGFFPVIPGVSEPAIVLSYDGQAEDRMMLTLSEVLQLKLHPEMVVLSACNTGSGKVTRSEGVSSMGTAFLAAGASSVTMSLWKVADKSTAILMQEFYKNILSGTSKAASLAAARSALVSRGYNNPFYWAPFVLTGD